MNHSMNSIMNGELPFIPVQPCVCKYFHVKSRVGSDAWYKLSLLLYGIQAVGVYRCTSWRVNAHCIEFECCVDIVNPAS